MKSQIIKLNEFPLKLLALPVLILLILFLNGCRMKTAGTYSGKVSMTYGDFRAQKFDVENVSMTIEKTGVDKQYNRWNEHKIIFDEKSPLQCQLELELEGAGKDEARNRPEGLYSQVVKRQNCEITKKDGTKVKARAESGEVYVSEDFDGSEIFQGRMRFKSQETDVFNEYEITIKAKRKSEKLRFGKEEYIQLYPSQAKDPTLCEVKINSVEGDRITGEINAVGQKDGKEFSVKGPFTAQIYKR